uniref:Uncharacterized protein n=1 Tax=Rhizophora mucronata TaxID=61149 RepID=A0A2P2N4F5_RHIMU
MTALVSLFDFYWRTGDGVGHVDRGNIMPFNLLVGFRLCLTRESWIPECG